MKSVFRISVLLLGFINFLTAQVSSCVTSAVPPIVSAEGYTERVGDINYVCNGVAGASVVANFTIAMNTNISNRISSGNILTGIIFTIDQGSGPQPVLVQPLLNLPNTLVYNGVSLTFSAQGTLAVRVSDIRVNATLVSVNNQIIASLGINVAGVPLTSSQLTVGTPQRGLYVGYSSAIVCAQNGSPLPATIGFASLIMANTVFASTRVTEGFADAFGPRSAGNNLNADSGQRIIARYSGLPQDASLFVPDVVAGSDAVQPTAGGDFGVPASGGAYAPSANGSLLLARVAGASANGAGGTPVYLPGAIGSGTVNFDSISQLQLDSSGSAYVVYEVVDANPSAQETAQFPTFLGLAPSGTRTASQTAEAVFFAPQSTVGSASPTEPLPRYAGVTPQPDCGIIGDCSTYLPQLSVGNPPLQFSGVPGTGVQQGYFVVANTGGGVLQWTASVSYANGAGWLSLDSYQGINGSNVRVYASPDALTPGVYKATIAVNAGAAGSQTLPVTLTVSAPPAAPAPVPLISSVVSAASFAAVPVVPGSLTTILGSGFTGKSVSATFNSLPAMVLFSNASQINLLVPAALGQVGSTHVVVSVDGSNSAVETVAVAAFEPAIFSGAVLNQDYTVNDVNHGAGVGSIIQIFVTGLSTSGTVTGHIFNEDINTPYYAGPAPGLLGVQQVDLVVPGDLTAMTTEVSICETGSDSAKVCSIAAPLTLK
jgi:uncharacterized protein (TIGR03437 family)